MIKNQKGFSLFGVVLFIIIGAIATMMILKSINSKSSENISSAKTETGESTSKKAEDTVDLKNKTVNIDKSTGINTTKGRKKEKNPSDLQRSPTVGKNRNQKKSINSKPEDKNHPVQLANNMEISPENEEDPAFAIRGLTVPEKSEFGSNKVLSKHEIREIYDKRIRVMEMLD